MQPWLVYSLISLLLWGIYGFFPKISVAYIGPKSAIIFQTIGAIIITLIIFVFFLKLKAETNQKGMFFSVLTGIAGTAGTLFFLAALNAGGKTSVVVTMTALYPLVTMLLSFLLLHETITVMQATGMILALIAIMIMTR